MSPQLFELIADIKLAGPDIEEVDAAWVGPEVEIGAAVAGRCVGVGSAKAGLVAVWTAFRPGALP